MSKLKDITSEKFGKLTVLYRLHNDHHKREVYWLCVCECGNLKEVQGANLKSGHTKSCGCLVYKHDKSNTRLYHCWQGMKDRCYSKNNISYKDYGGRGIEVCEEWKDDFEAFYNWAINNDYKEDLTIDRIDVNGNYTPDNCRWATRKEQQRNRRNTKYITYDGETRTLKEWCEILNLNYKRVWQRLYKFDWPIERALEREVNGNY